MSKYVPAVFQPTVRPAWVGILSYVSNEEKAQILEAILKYPQQTDIKSKFWEETIKPDLETQYTKFTKSCEAKGCGSRTYWESKDKDNISLPYDKHKDNISISRDKVLKDKDKDKDKNNNRGNCKGGEELHFGTLKNVILTEKQYSELKEKYPNLDDGIEELDTWLGKNSKSAKEARNKNHYAYFKQNSWVWERVAENSKNKQQPIEYALPKSTTKEEIQKLVEERKREDEETKQRSAEAQRRSDFIKSKGYASVVSLISAGKDVYDKVMAEYRQAQGF